MADSPKSSPTENEILNAIRKVARNLGRPPSKVEFKAKSGITEYHVLKYFPSWNEAIREAGLVPDSSNVRLDDEQILADWGELVRRERQIPTRDKYRREGKYSPGVFEKHFGPWSTIPEHFRKFAQGKPKWADVLPLLPPERPIQTIPHTSPAPLTQNVVRPHHSKLNGRPTYGNPIDFRGLRHEPVNEQGVVFLFGMVARELGYMVEAMQAGFPDCEAKRQVEPGKW